MRKGIILIAAITVFACTGLDAEVFTGISNSPVCLLTLAKKPPAPARGYTPSKSARQKALEKKIKNIIIPSVDFDEIDIRDAFKYLSDKSGEYSKDKKKVNIIVILPQAEKNKRFPITLRLTDIPLADAIRYIAISADLEVKVENYAVVIRRPAQKR